MKCKFCELVIVNQTLALIAQILLVNLRLVSSELLCMIESAQQFLA